MYRDIDRLSTADDVYLTNESHEEKDGYFVPLVRLCLIGKHTKIDDSIVR